MTSETGPEEAFVWIWLPREIKPVVAGRLARTDGQLAFNYGRSYLARKDAIPIYEPELPLKSGILRPLPGLALPSCIRDAAPDAWGRRVILNRKFGLKSPAQDTADLDELTYLLESGSDRIGALDFQLSPSRYEPRETKAATLEELLNAATRVEEGKPLNPEIDLALFHGSSLGGARPKAMIENGDKKYIAKFSSQTDVDDVVKAEFVAMRLAERVGLHTAPVALARAGGKDVLLIERFDREKVVGGWRRKAMVSALTLFGLDEMMARYASYEELAEIVRHRFETPKETLRELFGRTRVQHSLRQHGRSRPQSCGVLERARPPLDPCLRYLPAATLRLRSHAGDVHIGRNPAEPSRRLYPSRRDLLALAGRSAGHCRTTGQSDSGSMA